MLPSFAEYFHRYRCYPALLSISIDVDVTPITIAKKIPKQNKIANFKS